LLNGHAFAEHDTGVQLTGRCAVKRLAATRGRAAAAARLDKSAADLAAHLARGAADVMSSDIFQARAAGAAGARLPVAALLAGWAYIRVARRRGVPREGAAGQHRGERRASGGADDEA